jgi:hypothetical protein
MTNCSWDFNDQELFLEGISGIKNCSSAVFADIKKPDQTIAFKQCGSVEQ